MNRQFTQDESAAKRSVVKRGAARQTFDLFSSASVPIADTVAPKADCACGGGCPSCAEDAGHAIQTKLAVSTPGDYFEEEADRVADRIMRMPDSMAQRQCAGCANASGADHIDEHSLAIQRHANASAGTNAVASDFTNRLGAGAPLDSATRDYFEPRFGHDFSNVRIHHDGQAAAAAAGVQARAFTLGHDVVFAAGEHNPSSESGRRLLAHELTHVVQQQGGRSLSGSAVPPVRGRVSRMIQRQQTDASFEAGSGVGAGVTAGTMVADNAVMGQTFTAQNCRGLYGCNILFEFGKGYTGTYPYVAGGRDVRGVYVKISASFNAPVCGTCATIRFIQDLRSITLGASGMETADPVDPTRRARSGWSDPAARSRGWRLDQVTTGATSTDPFYPSHSANSGTSVTPAILWDVPGEWTDARNTGRELQSCVVCENAGVQRKVLACVTWGFYIDSSGVVAFRPATPTVNCGPTQELEDATARFEAIAGNLPANIDFTRETGIDQTGQTSVLWFQQNSTTLRQDAEIDSTVHMANALRRIRQHLAVGANAGIVVHGYASEEGDPVYNMQLARRRAEVIQARLLAEGIPADRITIQVHGESTTWPTRAYNRRVEIEHTLPPAGAGP